MLTLIEDVTLVPRMRPQDVRAGDLVRNLRSDEVWLVVEGHSAGSLLTGKSCAIDVLLNGGDHVRVPKGTRFEVT